MQVLDLKQVELVYSSSFFKSIETGGNVSRALVSSCKVQGGGGGGLLVSLVCCTRFTLYNILCYHIFSTVIQCRKCYDFYKENFDGAIICHFLALNMGMVWPNFVSQL